MRLSVAITLLALGGSTAEASGPERSEYRKQPANYQSHISQQLLLTQVLATPRFRRIPERPSLKAQVLAAVICPQQVFAAFLIKEYRDYRAARELADAIRQILDRMGKGPPVPIPVPR